MLHLQDAEDTSANGVTRLREIIPQEHTIVIGVREYTGWMWGKRMPRTVEARVRQAAHDLDIERAKLGDEPPVRMDAEFIDRVRTLLAQAAIGTSPELIIDQLKQAVQKRDGAAALPQAQFPMWQSYLNRVLCALVDGLSPILADLLDQNEVNQILHDLHYPGFWKDPEVVTKVTDPPMATVTTQMSQTGSTSKPESPPLPESASVTSEQ